jgi:predicted dehydrogenase
LTTTPPTIRFGVIGCGVISREAHVPSLLETPGASIDILCDSLEKNALQTKAMFRLSAETTTNVKDFAERVDAAIVAVPARFHAPITHQLLEMGIDVLCEKPFAISTAEAESMVAKAKEKKRLLAVGMVTRFHPNNELIRLMLDDSTIGDIVEVVAEFGTCLDWPMPTDSYYNKSMTGGGVFFEGGVHLLDRVLWLFGDLSDIAYADDSYGGMESNAELSGNLRIHGRRVPCQMAFSWTHALANSIRVKGMEGTLEAKFSTPEEITLERRLGTEQTALIIRRDAKNQEKQVFQSLFHHQIADFINAIRNRIAPFVSADSTIAAMRTIEAAYAVRKRIPQSWVETKE